jgi:hypothetical protein
MIDFYLRLKKKISDYFIHQLRYKAFENSITLTLNPDVLPGPGVYKHRNKNFCVYNKWKQGFKSNFDFQTVHVEREIIWVHDIMYR